LRQPDTQDPPVSIGIWGEIYEHLYQQKKARDSISRKLQSQLDHLHESFRALPDGVVILSEGNVIDWGNESASRYLGLRFPQDRGMQLTNLVRTPEFVDYLDRGDFSSTFELTSPVQESIKLQLQLTEFSGVYKILFARDLTAMRQTEKVRKDFIANVSHELRTPLTVINGYLETLSAWVVDHAPDWTKPVRQMLDNTERMEQLVEGLILLSRMETLAEWQDKPEQEVAIRPLLESICQNARGIGSDREISLECRDDLFYRGHRLELESIFSNLILNAVRYTEPGGHIHVVFKTMPDSVVFSVTDNGVGIDPRHIPRLTERFYRADPGRSTDTGGAGLGLAIVKHALKPYDGELQIESKPGHGSTFSCTMDVSRADYHNGQHLSAS
jgi:two-component system phosphate regulon sensor histidine kinase PhoR